MKQLSFFEKYKPKTLDEFILDDNLKLLLTTFLKIDKLNFFIYGDCGSGKTTLINIIINKYYNDFLHNREIINKNIIRINTLNDCGMSFLRNEIKTFCKIPCTIPNKKKILILDDIDNINAQCQQIFRNFIDNYSHNVIFIGSCISLQKIISSIQSRIKIIKIQPINNNKLERIMENIIQHENIKIDEESKKFIINISQNSIRILITYLEKLYLLNKSISIELCKKISTNINYDLLTEYTRNIFIKKHLEKSLIQIQNIIKDGYSVIDVLHEYYYFIKNTEILEDKLKYKIITVICKYISYFYSKQEHSIELSLFTNELYNLNHELIKL